MEMLGGCDLRVASDIARFGVMEPKRGLFAGGGTTVRLPDRSPIPPPWSSLLCADRVRPQRAYEIGPPQRGVPAGRSAGRAYDYAHRITANGPFAIRKTRSRSCAVSATDMGEAYKIETEISNQVFSSEDAKEGPLAFAEKRTPDWEESLSRRSPSQDVASRPW